MISSIIISIVKLTIVVVVVVVAFSHLVTQIIIISNYRLEIEDQL